MGATEIVRGNWQQQRWRYKTRAARVRLYPSRSFHHTVNFPSNFNQASTPTWGITELACEYPKTYEDKHGIILTREGGQSRNDRLLTGVFTYTRLRLVKPTLERKSFWCIASASNDPHDSNGLPSRRPPKEKYL